MITVSNEYKEACNSPIRKSYIVAKYGNFNKKAKGKINGVESDNKPFGSNTKTYNETKSTEINYISCEPNRVKLDETFYFISDKTNANVKEDIAFWSSELSNENGNFTNNPQITYFLDSAIEFIDLTLHFQEVCSEFNVKYYNDTTLVAQSSVANNEELTVSTEANVESNTVIYFNKVKIEFVKTGEPYRYIKFNEVDFGVYEQFGKEQIVDINIIEDLSIDSSEISSNSLNLTIDDHTGKYDILNPFNKLKKLQEKQEISVYHYLYVNGVYQELPLGTFLLKQFDSVDNRLEIEAYDDIYFMNKIYYGSNFYENATMKKVLEDLFEYFDYKNYVISSEVASLTLTGFIPNVEFREAIRLVCEACGCLVRKTRFGVTEIYKTSSDETKTFTRDIIFSESPSRNLFNNVIDIVEYNYGEVVENTIVFKGELDIGKHIVLFSKLPVKQDTIEKNETNANYTIEKKYATSCVVNVLTKTNVVLKASVCELTSVVKRVSKEEDTSADEYTIDKIENYLITSNNSTTIADWKIGKKDIKYNFNTLVAPYIEVGDKCTYKTKYDTENEFIPTRIEFTKSIKQTIEGE